jgi:hypothetical protein
MSAHFGDIFILNLKTEGEPSLRMQTTFKMLLLALLFIAGKQAIAQNSWQFATYQQTFNAGNCSDVCATSTGFAAMASGGQVKILDASGNETLSFMVSGARGTIAFGGGLLYIPTTGLIQVRDLTGGSAATIAQTTAAYDVVYEGSTIVATYPGQNRVKRHNIANGNITVNRLFTAFTPQTIQALSTGFAVGSVGTTGKRIDSGLNDVNDFNISVNITGIAADANDTLLVSGGIQFVYLLTPVGNTNYGLLANGTTINTPRGGLVVGNICYIANSSGIDVFEKTSGPLAAELRTFTANLAADKRTVRLNWEVANESLSGYEVAYGPNATNFDSIGWVAATGSGSSYVFQHTPTPGKAYYRLQTIEPDGSPGKRSNVVSAYVRATQPTLKGNLVAAGNQLTLTMPDDGPSEVMAQIIVTASGQILWEGKVQKGENTLTAPMVSARCHIAFKDTDLEVIDLVITY